MLALERSFEIKRVTVSFDHRMKVFYDPGLLIKMSDLVLRYVEFAAERGNLI